MVKKIKYSVVTYQETLEDDYKDPSTWFVVGATGDRYYFHYRTRNDAQRACNELLGEGKYKIRTDKTVKPKGSTTANGYINSKSRAGMRKS